MIKGATSDNIRLVAATSIDTHHPLCSLGVYELNGWHKLPGGSDVLLSQEIIAIICTFAET